MAKMSRLAPSRSRPLLDYLEGMTVAGQTRQAGKLEVDELGVVAQQFLPTDSNKSSSSSATSFAFEVN